MKHKILDLSTELVKPKFCVTTLMVELVSPITKL